MQLIRSPKLSRLLGEGDETVSWRATWYLVVLLGLSLSLAFAIKVFRPAPLPVGEARILSLISPRNVKAGERYGVYVGLSLPEGTFDKRLRICGEQGCIDGSWGRITGPAEWWGSLYYLELEPGQYQAELLLLRTWGDGLRTVARRSWEVVAY